MHKLYLALIISLIVASVDWCFGQTTQPSAVETGVEKRMLDAARNGSTSAIRMIAATGERKNIPYLEELLKKEVSRPEQEQGLALVIELRAAIAQLGSAEQMDWIIQNMANTENLDTQEIAFRVAKRVGGNKIITQAAKLLSSEAPGGRSERASDVGYMPTRIKAVTLLSHLIIDAPIKQHGVTTDDEVEAWKAWWVEHQLEYAAEEKETPGKASNKEHDHAGEDGD